MKFLFCLKIEINNSWHNSFKVNYRSWATHFVDIMNLFDNLSQLSKRGLLEVPNPEPKYQIVQFPKDFIRVEDTVRVFGTSFSTAEENVSIVHISIWKIQIIILIKVFCLDENIFLHVL